MTHRFYPTLRNAQEILRSGKIGKVVSVRDYYMESIDRTDFPAWFFDPFMAGGGVALTDAIHLVDRVSWLLEEDLNLLSGVSRKLRGDSEVEDCVELLCQSRTGLAVSIASFFCDGPRYWEDGLTIFGMNGSMTIHAWSHIEVCIYGEKPRRIEGYDPALTQPERSSVGHRAAIGEFVVSIRENRQPEANIHSALNAQEVIQEFYDQIRKNL